MNVSGKSRCLTEPMKITILTIFPEMCEQVLSCSILGRAREAGLIDTRAVDIRAYSASKHKNTDDYPFGGGQGMLMTPQPIADAMKDVCGQDFKGLRIYMGPKGDRLDQKLVAELAQQPVSFIESTRFVLAKLGEILGRIRR